MKTAVIYARYSCDNQTEQSIEGQLRVCEQYAKNNNILILHTYIDRAMTGTNDNRPDFQQMLKDSNKKEWDYVLVYKFDRFSRNKYETTIHKHTLATNGIKVLSAMENIPDTPEGIILESLLEGMNQYYSAELAQKVRRGMHESRLKGHFTGGKLPYGYKLDGKKIIIDEEKAEVIRFMFYQYSIDSPASEIINSLTAKGIIYNGKPFNKTTVYKILKNERYTGIYKLNGEEFNNMYPQIISIELFQKVQAKAAQYQYGTRSEKAVYLFKHKLKCGYCGKPISSECTITRKGEKINYYKCLGIKKYRNVCPKQTLRQEEIETFLMNAIIDELEKPEIIDTIVKNLLELQKSRTDNNQTLNFLIKSKKQAEKSLQNIINAVEQGIINNTTGKRMKELEEQIENLEKQILIEQSKSNILLTEEDIKTFYREALHLESFALINYLIKEIKLYNDKVEITFNSPLQKSPDNKNQGFSFLTKFRYFYKNIQHILEPIEIKVEINYFVA